MYVSSFQHSFIALAAWASLYPSTFSDHSSIVLDHLNSATELAMQQLLVQMLLMVAADSNSKDMWASLSSGRHFDDAIVTCVAVRNIPLL